MKNAPHYIVIVDNTEKCQLDADPSRFIVSASDYITGNLPAGIDSKKSVKVINLCSEYSYLRSGYYCSLLARARGHRCIPGVSDIVHAKWKRLHRDSIDDILSNPEQASALNKAIETLKDHKTATFFFGRTVIPEFEKLGRILFDEFRLPIIKVTFALKKDKWAIQSIEQDKLANLGEQKGFFDEALSKYIGSYWNKKKALPERYWLAILHDKDEPMPPSNAKALEKMIALGKKRRFFVELIDKSKFDDLLEYDALFIRATTNVNHYTYRFAQKAEREDIPCLDDKNSILLCCNKVFLHELLSHHKINAPKTFFLGAQQKPYALQQGLSFPVVLKIADGSFSTGVFKVNSQEEYEQRLHTMFKQSELILVQEFLPSDYDWRIGVLDNKPLFACKYYMAKKHWQIYNHNSKNQKNKEGDFDAIPVEKIPPKVLKTALKATALIGDGLYGVDLKEIGGVPYVIEVNDNPNIDTGIEDKVEGNAVYEALFDYFEKKINL